MSHFTMTSKVIFCAWLLLSCSVSAKAQKKIITLFDVDPYTQKAEQLFGDKQYGEAVQEFQKGMLLIPNPIPAKKQYRLEGFDIDSSSVAGLCWTLSWYQLFSQNFIDAIRTAKRGIALDRNKALGIQVNLAHGYLLNSQFEEAKQLYLGNIGSQYSRIEESPRYWENVVVNDLQQFIQANIKPLVCKSMIDTVIKSAQQRAIGTTNSITSSVGIRAANNRYLSLSLQNFTFTSKRETKTLDDGFTVSYFYNIVLPPNCLVAQSEEIGELESFDLTRVASNSRRSNILNRTSIAIKGKFIALNEFILPLDYKIESASPEYNSVAKSTLDSINRLSYILSPFANSARIETFELLPVNAHSVRFRDSKGHYLAVDTTYGISKISICDEPNVRTVFELLNLDGTPFLHGIPLTAVKKERYEILKTYTAIAPAGQIDNLIGRGYTEDMKDGGIVIESKDTVESEYGQFNKRSYDIRDQFQLSANVGMLLANFSAQYESSNRYLVLQAYNISKVISYSKPPDIEKLKQSPVKVFVSKVYYGWALNYVVQGEESVFSANIAATIKLFKTNLGAEINSNKLSTSLSLTGFQGNSFLKDAAILFDKDEILAQGFKPLDKPVPIFVEYSIVNEFDVPKIDWR